MPPLVVSFLINNNLKLLYPIYLCIHRRAVSEGNLFEEGGHQLFTLTANRTTTDLFTCLRWNTSNSFGLPNLCTLSLYNQWQMDSGHLNQPGMNIIVLHRISQEIPGCQEIGFTSCSGTNPDTFGLAADR